MRYVAFVSYAHRDSRQARWLHRTVEAYRLPRSVAEERALPPRLGRLFLDRSELPSSSDLSAAIQTALGEAENMLLVCSPAAASSRWVNEEVRRFRDLRGRERIFCLIVDGDPGLRDGPGGCFPSALLAPDPGDEHPVEPLAADIRPGQDRRSEASLKIIAGLLDVEFDALRQREQARRFRRLAALTIIMGIIAAALLALIVVAVIARDEARRQADEAHRQAETATQTTEFLRQLFVSADPTAARGRELTVRETVDRGVDQIDSRPELRGQPKVRADLMTTLAEVYVNLGEWRLADALARRAARTDRSDPRTAMRQDAIRAEVAIGSGDFAVARDLLVRALAAQPNPSPARSSLLIDRALAERGLGADTAADRFLAEARRESLTQRPPDLEHADRALKEIATRDYQQGRYDQAQRGFEELLRSRRRLGAGDDPLVGTAFNELGAIRYKLGDNIAARRWFEQALRIEVKLLGNDHPKVATIRGNLARIMVEQRQFAPALRLLEETRAAIVREQGDRTALLAWQDDSIGLAHMGLGDRAAAEAAFRRGLGVARATGAAKEGDLSVDLSSLLCATGRARSAQPLLDGAARAYAGAAATPSWSIARAAQVRGRCLMLAGDRSAGAVLVRQNAPAVIARWGSTSQFGVEAAAALAAVRGMQR